MHRKITSELLAWKSSNYRKPLVLQGARQVGKTYSIMEFGRENYDNIVYINFENENMRKPFEESIDPQTLIPKLSGISKKSITKSRTLIFFDEIQLCPPALASLKYFNESAGDYHVIAAGSLLGVAVNRETYSFPVGKVNMKTLYPMDFEEFLYATHSPEFEPDFVEKIKNCHDANAPMESAYHNILLDKYRQYLVVGGLPECVDKYAATKNHELIRATQNEILTSYQNDMSKYNSKNEIQRTRLAYNSITAQLSKTNTRFQYKLVKSGGRASELENAIEWLSLSGVVNRVYGLDTVKKPLEGYKNIDSFKIFMSDVGLLCARYNLLANDILYGSDGINDFKGGMAENYVCNQLVANGHICYTWQSDGIAEMDFVIQSSDGKLIPIEVKSAENNKAKSLGVYMQKFKPEYAIKISAKNFGFENNIKTIPLYAAFCI
ncbi:MAG: ATP-binding protein [Oscillospiraceae bacterium]|nr:ATP-binding protein [Oscillospiraceae bacterium]MCL2159045.1 ATP-binding protein [Oscillospiraceae bacterium]